MSTPNPLIGTWRVESFERWEDGVLKQPLGSPPAGFREAYEGEGGRWPTPERLRLYQLYHLLNHVVLFGGAYAAQALRVARSLA